MRRLVGRLLRDPLVHFLAAGGLLFGVYDLIHGPPASNLDNQTIEVDRGKLITFLQYQSAAFKPEYFSAQFDAMSPQARQELIGKYVEEEALYREAQVLGLSEGDSVIRRRVVQKVLYLLDDTSTESFAPTEGQLQAYFRAHQDRYKVIPSVTFTHVFVDTANRRPEEAMRVAAALKQRLEARRAHFDDAPGYGDRFPYQQNYIGRDADFVKSQFGGPFAQALLNLTPSPHVWYGPIASQFGYHLVMLTDKTAAYVPSFTQVREEVKDDLLRDLKESYRNKAVADLVGRFKVREIGLPSVVAGAARPQTSQLVAAAP